MDALFSLIKSLSKSEKRHFKLARDNSVSKEKKYVLLFDLLEQQNHYNEAKIKLQLKSLGFKSDYFSADKNYLYKLILKTLRTYHEGKTTRQSINNALITVELLIEKGLGIQAKKVLRRAKKTAIKHELFSLVLELLHWERKLYGATNSLAEVKGQQKTYEEALGRHNNFMRYQFLYKEALIFRKEIAKSRSREALVRFDQFIKNPLLKNEKLALSFYAKMRFYQIFAAYYYSKDDTQKEFDCNQKIIELVEENNYFFKDYPLEYTAIFSRFLILTKKNKPQDYPRVLAEFRKIPKRQAGKKPKVEALVFTLSHSTEFTRLIQEKEFKTAATQIPLIRAGMKQYGKQIQAAFRMAMHYRFTYTYLVLGDYSTALTEVNILLNDFNETTRPDLFRFARLLGIIIHYELGNHSLVTHLSQSFLLLLKNRNQLFKAEALFIQRLKKIIRLPKEDHQEAYLAFKQEFTKILADPYERKILDYFDLLAWLEGKIEAFS